MVPHNYILMLWQGLFYFLTQVKLFSVIIHGSVGNRFGLEISFESFRSVQVPRSQLQVSYNRRFSVKSSQVYLKSSLFLLWCVCLRDLVVHFNHLIDQCTEVQIGRMLAYFIEVLQADSRRQLQIVVCQKPTASKKVLVKSDQFLRDLP
jgi:hypothetical protein